MRQKNQKTARPSCRIGPSRNGTRPTSTVIWPITRRRAEHVLLHLQLKHGKAAAPSMTDFNSNAVDALVKQTVETEGITLPMNLDLSITGQ